MKENKYNQMIDYKETRQRNKIFLLVTTLFIIVPVLFILLIQTIDKDFGFFAHEQTLFQGFKPSSLNSKTFLSVKKGRDIILTPNNSIIFKNNDIQGNTINAFDETLLKTNVENPQNNINYTLPYATKKSKLDGAQVQPVFLQNIKRIYNSTPAKKQELQNFIQKNIAQSTSSESDQLQIKRFYTLSSDFDNRYATNSSLFNNGAPPIGPGEDQDGGDPGDDPIGEPIPIPDGTIYLLFLTALYVAFKKRNLLYSLFSRM